MAYFNFENNITPANDTNLNAMQQGLMELVFPVGSTYITQSNTNPNTILKFGTWERLKGKVVVGLDEDDSDFDEIGKEVGEKTHTLTEAELPQLSGEINVPYAKPIFENATGIIKKRGSSSNVISIAQDNQGANNNASLGFSIEFGSGQAHNNIQPTKVVGYMWIRTA